MCCNSELYCCGLHSPVCLLVQDVDTQDEQVAGSSGGQDQGRLPVVPIPAQERQQLMSRLPPDIAPVLKAAADSLGNTADAQVSGHSSCSPMQQVLCCQACACVYYVAVGTARG